MRQQTGPLKIEDDWQGYFMRGDDALLMAAEMRLLADNIESMPSVVATWLRRKAELLETAKESRAA